MFRVLALFAPAMSSCPFTLNYDIVVNPRSGEVSLFCVLQFFAALQENSSN